MKNRTVRLRIQLAAAALVATGASFAGIAVASATPVFNTGPFTVDAGGLGSTATSNTGYLMKIKAPTVDAGTYTETLQADGFDSGYANLSTVNAGAGFTIQYKDLNGNWSTTRPSAVASVRAVGTVLSMGMASGGQQTWAGSQSFSRQTVSQLALGVNGVGDGWDVSFDPSYSRIYNVYHHSNPSAIDCHFLADGTRCPNFPYFLKSVKTNHRPHATVDSNGNIYLAGNKGNQIGFECVTQSGQPCGFKVAATIADSSLIIGTYNNFVGGDFITGGKIFGQLATTGALFCYDLTANTSCAGMPATGWDLGLTSGTTLNTTAGAYWSEDQSLSGNYVYAVAPGSAGYGQAAAYASAKVSCFDLTTLAKCAGTWPQRASGIAMLDNVGGTSTWGVCTLGDIARCYNTNGSTKTIPTGLASSLTTLPAGGPMNNYGNGNFSTADNRHYYWSAGTWYAAISPNSAAMMCWDAVLGAKCSNVFPIRASAFTGAGAVFGTSYTAVADPTNPKCVWTNSDKHELFGWNTTTGTVGCPPVVGAPNSNFTFAASGADITKSASCGGTDNTTGWGSLVITSDTSTATAYKVTVKNSAGGAIPGYTNIMSTNINGQQGFDLSALTVAQLGQTPSFEVTAIGFGASGSISLSLFKTSDTPQLCITLKTSAYFKCPSISTLLSGVTVDNTGTIAASYSFTDGSSTVSDSQNITYTITNGFPADRSTCMTLPKVPTWGNISDSANSINYTTYAPTDTGGATAAEMNYYMRVTYTPWTATSYTPAVLDWTATTMGAQTFSSMTPTTDNAPLLPGNYCFSFDSQNPKGYSYANTIWGNASATFCVKHSVAPITPAVSNVRGVITKGATSGTLWFNFATGYNGLPTTYTANVNVAGVPLLTGTAITTAGHATLSIPSGLGNAVTVQVQACNDYGCTTSDFSSPAINPVTGKAV